MAAPATKTLADHGADHHETGRGPAGPTGLWRQTPERGGPPGNPQAGRRAGLVLGFGSGMQPPVPGNHRDHHGTRPGGLPVHGRRSRVGQSMISRRGAELAWSAFRSWAPPSSAITRARQAVATL